MSNRRLAASTPEDSENVEQLREEVRSLREALRDLAATTKPAKDPKVDDPKEFDGKDPSLLPTFLFQVGLVFKAKPSTYPTEESRVILRDDLPQGPCRSLRPTVPRERRISAVVDRFLVLCRPSQERFRQS